MEFEEFRHKIAKTLQIPKKILFKTLQIMGKEKFQPFKPSNSVKIIFRNQRIPRNF